MKNGSYFAPWRAFQAVERINPDGIRRYKLPLGEYSSIILASAILFASQFLKPHSKPHGAVVTFRNKIEIIYHNFNAISKFIVYAPGSYFINCVTPLYYKFLKTFKAIFVGNLLLLHLSLPIFYLFELILGKRTLK